ncbi:MAG: GTPase HflX, partial [Candidatus Kariarchaeaceae archaeon]
NSNQGNNNALDEFKFLIESAGYSIHRIFTQKRNPTSSFFFGEGFWEDLLTEMEGNNDASTAIINTTLTPLQVLNINKKLQGHFQIIDEFNLILEIFTNRASTEEAILQIDLAKIKYQLPFAKANLVSQRVSERIGFRQSGELKSRDLENTYKRFQATINAKLEKIKTQRITRRKERLSKAQSNEVLTLSLLGYTNAGKSSFLNAISNSDKKVEVANQLFTTLGTTSRRFQYYDLPIILTDTVGFYQALPASLIDAFRSTLEESLVTDYILILVDASEDTNSIERKLTTSLNTLDEIDSNLFSKVWIILTKLDLVDKSKKNGIIGNLEEILSNYHVDITKIAFVSSLDSNFNEFTQLIENEFPLTTLSVQISVDFHQIHSLRSKLYQETNIKNENYHESFLNLNLETHRLSYITSLIKSYSSEDKKINYQIL